MMHRRRLVALARKEFIQMGRDIRSLIAAVAIPLMMIFLFGYALSLDVDRIPTLVLDRDRSPASRDFIGTLGDSRYFSIVGYIDSESEIDDAMDRGQALMALVIPNNFGAQVGRGLPVELLAVFDGSDSNTASIAMGYVKAATAGYELNLQAARIARAGQRMADMPLEMRARVWFNPELKSKNFIVPGLTAIIMMVICALMTSLAVSKERETGTFEQLVSTPITSTELLIGKLIPNLAVGLLDLALVVGAGVLIFKVPFRGSYLALLGTSLVFLVGTLAWGLFISVVSKNQLQASMMAMITVFLPSFLLSGFIYPIENMPVVIQAITYAVPARYFVEILKGLFLKGVGPAVLWPQGLALVIYAVAVMNLARRKFIKRLA